jgi:hypothetical protein
LSDEKEETDGLIEIKPKETDIKLLYHHLQW